MMTTGCLIVHETAGVCRLNGRTRLTGMKGEYYVLTPLYLNDATLYVPADNSKVKIRPVMSRQQAEELISRLPRIEPVCFESLNDQKVRCASILKSGDSYQLASLVKALYQHQQRRSRQNKRSAITDTAVLKKAESLLFGELAAALEIDYPSVLDRVEGLLK